MRAVGVLSVELGHCLGEAVNLGFDVVLGFNDTGGQQRGDGGRNAAKEGDTTYHQGHRDKATLVGNRVRVAIPHRGHGGKHPPGGV